MLKAYMDRGQKSDKDDEILTVASVIYDPDPYKRFCQVWNKMLKPWGASAFHATDFYPGGGEFKRDTPERQKLYDRDSKRIPIIVGKFARRIAFVSFRPEEFNLTAPPRWKEYFGKSIHSQAVQLVLIANGWWRHTRCRHKTFAYFMESGDEEEGQIVKTVERMRQDKQNGTGAVIGVSLFTPVDKKTVSARGLEAADFVAWQWNKHYMDKIRTGKQQPRKDFEAFANAHRKVDHIFATGEKLKFFFSLVPTAVLKDENDTKIDAESKEDSCCRDSSDPQGA